MDYPDRAEQGGTAVVAVVGWHNAGKTTFIEGLVRELKRRGYRVAAIKHSRGHYRWDEPGTDTWRMDRAGSDIVAITGSDRWVVSEHLAHEPTLEEAIARLPSSVDIVVAEGFKGSAVGKFEVMRAATGSERIATSGNLLALVTDEAALAQPGDVRLSPSDAAGAVDLLVSRGLLQVAPGGKD